jgi:hypothetical protein
VWPKEEQNGEALAVKQKAEMAHWAPVIKGAGIKVQ